MRPTIPTWQRWFERILWNSRYIVLIAVAACVFVAVLLYSMVTIQAFRLPMHLGAFFNSNLTADDRSDLYTAAVANIASVIDGYLFATIMLIFAMGLYELFISKIDVAEDNELARRILLIRSIDDLKDRLAKVIFLVLIVKFFEYALHLSYSTPMELLQLAAGILLIAAGLWLTGKSSSHG
jgi:uncharacterized membrane protein YqhA